MIRAVALTLALAAAAGAGARAARAAGAADLCAAYADVNNCAAKINPATGAGNASTACLPFGPSFTWAITIDPTNRTLWGLGGKQSRMLTGIDIATGSVVASVLFNTNGTGAKQPYALSPTGVNGGLYALWFDTTKCDSKYSSGYCFATLDIAGASVTPVPVPGAPAPGQIGRGNQSCYPVGNSAFSTSGRTAADGSFVTVWSCGPTHDLFAVFVGGQLESFVQVAISGLLWTDVVDFWAHPTDGVLWVLSRSGDALIVNEVHSDGSLDNGSTSMYGVSSQAWAFLVPLEAGVCIFAVESGSPARVQCSYDQSSGDSFLSSLSSSLPGLSPPTQPYDAISAPVPCLF